MVLAMFGIINAGVPAELEVFAYKLAPWILQSSFVPLFTRTLASWDSLRSFMISIHHDALLDDTVRDVVHDKILTFMPKSEGSSTSSERNAESSSLKFL